jgi:hypothetical protein
MQIDHTIIRHLFFQKSSLVSTYNGSRKVHGHFCFFRQSPQRTAQQGNVYPTATPCRHSGRANPAPLYECTGWLPGDGAECSAADAGSMASGSRPGYPGVAGVDIDAHRQPRRLGPAFSALCTCPRGERTVAHLLFPRRATGGDHLGLCRRGVIPHHLKHASGISHLCHGGHDCWRGRVVSRQDASILELCVPDSIYQSLSASSRKVTGWP